MRIYSKNKDYDKVENSGVLESWLMVIVYTTII